MKTSTFILTQVLASTLVLIGFYTWFWEKLATFCPESFMIFVAVLLGIFVVVPGITLICRTLEQGL